MMKSEAVPLFTVFTGTYNRGPLLRRVYECLLAQTCQDFEWIVVDDGSTDDTRERVAAMVREGRLCIRYFFKPNGGVHTAHNLAVREARGRLFMRCGSDDEFTADAVDAFRAAWLGIPAVARAGYSGVSCLCVDDDGVIVGDSYPSDVWDADWRTLASLRGEKWGVHLTRVLREFPFPVFAGECFVPEGLIWARIHKRYRTKCINTSLRTYSSSPDSLSNQLAQSRYTCGNGYEAYYREQLGYRQPFVRAAKLACNYVRVARGLHASWYRLTRRSPRPVLTALAAPVGELLYRLDRAHGFTGEA